MGCKEKEALFKISYVIIFQKSFNTVVCIFIR